MNILFMRIGFTNPETNEFVFQKAEGEARVFIQKLLEYTVKNKKTRVYQFRPEEKMADIVLSFAQATLAPLETELNLDIDSQLNTIMNRLIEAENKANKQLGEKWNKVKTGSIVLSLVVDDEKVPYFVFAKVDHTRYLEGDKLELQTGFSVENRDIWKTAVIRIRQDRHVSLGDVLVYMDRPARYWTDWFLGLTAVRTDALNTSTMFLAVKNTLKKELEKSSLNDYLILWQSLVHRINADNAFDYNEFIEKLLKEYKPQTDELDDSRKEALMDKLLQLPEKEGFDMQFNLDPGDIGTMIKFQVIKIAPGIELKVSRDVDVHRVISSVQDNNGNKYIRIRCTNKQVHEQYQ